MKGSELKSWRERNGYFSQTSLMDELGIRSRTTMSSLENSEDSIPRVYLLALIALERHPELRTVASQRLPGATQRKARQLAPPLSDLSSTYDGNRIDYRR